MVVLVPSRGRSDGKVIVSEDCLVCLETLFKRKIRHGSGKIDDTTRHERSKEKHARREFEEYIERDRGASEYKEIRFGESKGETR